MRSRCSRVPHSRPALDFTGPTIVAPGADLAGVPFQYSTSLSCLWCGPMYLPPLNSKCYRVPDQRTANIPASNAVDGWSRSNVASSHARPKRRLYGSYTEMPHDPAFSSSTAVWSSCTLGQPRAGLLGKSKSAKTPPRRPTPLPAWPSWPGRESRHLCTGKPDAERGAPESISPVYWQTSDTTETNLLIFRWDGGSIVSPPKYSNADDIFGENPHALFTSYYKVSVARNSDSSEIHRVLTD